MGRPPTPLPFIAPDLEYIRTAADRIAALLEADGTHRNRLFEGAWVLAFICEWHLRKLPFPTRAQVAQWLDCSQNCVNQTLSCHLLWGYLKKEIEIIEGNNRSRQTGIQQIHIVPSDDLLGAYYGQRLWPREARLA